MNSINQEYLTKHKLKKNVIITFLVNIMAFSFILISSIIIARVLGPTLQGVFALIIVSIALISSLTDFGLSYTFTVFTAKKKYNIGRLNFVACLVCIITGIIVSFLLFSSSNYLSTNLLKGLSFKYILLIGLLFPLEKYKSYSSSILLGANKVGLLNFINFSFTFLNMIMTFIVLVILKQGLPGLLNWFITFQLLSALVYFILVNKAENLKPKVDLQMIRELIQFGWKIYVANFAGYLYTQIDRYIVNLFVGPIGMGWYHISKNLTEKLGIFQSSIAFAVASPTIKEGERESWELSSKATHYNLQITFIICIFLFIIAPYLIPFLYGEKFVSSISVFQILLIAQIFANSGGGILAHYISGNLGKPLIPAIIAWVSLLIGIPLGIVLTKNYGINGAALAMTITYAIAVLLTFSYIKFFLKKPISQIFIPKKEDINTYINLTHQFIKR